MAGLWILHRRLSSTRDLLYVQCRNTPMYAAVCLPTPVVRDNCHFPVDLELLCENSFLQLCESTSGDAFWGRDGVNNASVKEHDRLQLSTHQNHKHCCNHLGGCRGCVELEQPRWGNCPPFRRYLQEQSHSKILRLYWRINMCWMLVNEPNIWTV